MVRRSRAFSRAGWGPSALRKLDSPHPNPSPEGEGLEKKTMTETNASSTFVNIGERTNVTGSAAFKKLILADD